MNRRTVVGLGTVTLLFAGLGGPRDTLGQTAQDLVGSWTMVSNFTTRTDGSKIPTWGDNPKGNLILASDGRFSAVVMRADLAKFASNNRVQGTPEENKAVVQGSIAFFGTYSVSDKAMILKVEGSTFPNWTGTEQKRPFSISGDEMKWTVATGSGGGTVELVWKRAK